MGVNNSRQRAGLLGDIWDEGAGVLGCGDVESWEGGGVENAIVLERESIVASTVEGGSFS